jgi:hypothetical protein
MGLLKNETKRAEDLQPRCQITCRLIQNRKGYIGKAIQIQDYAKTGYNGNFRNIYSQGR